MLPATAIKRCTLLPAVGRRTASTLAVTSRRSARAPSNASRRCMLTMSAQSHPSIPVLSSSTRSIHTPTPTAAAASNSNDASSANQTPSVLVCGGNGALGQAMISTFKQAGYRTISIDFNANPSSDINLLLQRDKNWKENLASMHDQLHALLSSTPTGSHLTTDVRNTSNLEVVIHCAGSWIGGDVQDVNLPRAVDTMLEINLKSAVMASILAARCLTQQGQGMLVLTGAAAAAHDAPTPTMLAYGMSKAATHQLAKSLADKDSGLKNSTVITLLPTMIDTPTNRSFNSNTAEYANWTPPKDFANFVLSYATQLQKKRPASSSTKQTASTDNIMVDAPPMQNGGFYVFQTAQGKTSIKTL